MKVIKTVTGIKDVADDKMMDTVTVPEK